MQYVRSMEENMKKGFWVFDLKRDIEQTKRSLAGCNRKGHAAGTSGASDRLARLQQARRSVLVFLCGKYVGCESCQGD